MSKEKVHTETVEVEGDHLLAKVKEIVREGNVRRITITNEKGKRLLVIPLTLGVVGAVLLPVYAAVGALAAVMTKCTIEIERKGDKKDEAKVSEVKRTFTKEAPVAKRHVVPNRDGGWDVKKPGASRASAHTTTQAEAERRAKEIVRNAGGGEVRIHGRDGRIRDSDTVAPGRDPHPPKDRKH